MSYMGKILFVNLTDNTFEDIVLKEETYRQYIGGYGLGVRILYEKIKPKADHLGSENIIGFISGPMAGTDSPNGGRFMVVGKSPLTGGWGDSNCGGYFSPALKSTGYDGIFFIGKSVKPVYLWLTDKTKEIRDAKYLWGKDSIETEERIKKELGLKGIQVACIGPAGEKLSKISGVMHDHGRAAGRSGLGAVMGSKNLKAIAVMGSLKPPIADEEELRKIVTALREEVKTNPTPVLVLLRDFGTPGGYIGSVISQDAPIQNWKGVVEEAYTVKQAEKLGGESYIKFRTRKYACAQCPIVCGALLEVKDPKGNLILTSHRPQYETISAFGSMCLIDDIETLMKANELCNRYGFDTISVGATIAFAIECFERGILTKKETGGIPLKWGNKEAILKIVQLMSKRESIGDTLADGVKVAAEKIGKGAEEFAMHAGGQELPMHDPRLNPGFGYTYEFDPTPGRHTLAGSAYAEMGLVDRNLEPCQLGDLVAEKYHYDIKGKGKVFATYNHWYHFMNSTGLCLFALLSFTRYPVVEIVRSLTGWKEFDLKEALTAGERINTLRHCFNLREGIKPDDFKLPKRVLGIPTLPRGPIARVTIDTNTVKRSYFEELDWDPVTGKPSETKLKVLGLSALVGSL